MRRVGKMPIVEFGDLALLIHLMSAGRLQLFDERASLRDKRSRLLVRHRRRARAAAARVRHPAACVGQAAADPTRVAADEAVATLGPEAWPPPPLDEFAELIDQPRHLHPLLRDQRVIAGIGRSWVDEILWEARLSPFQQGNDLDRGGGRARSTRRSARCSGARSSTTRR